MTLILPQIDQVRAESWGLISQSPWLWYHQLGPLVCKNVILLQYYSWMYIGIHNIQFIPKLISKIYYLKYSNGLSYFILFHCVKALEALGISLFWVGHHNQRASSGVNSALTEHVLCSNKKKGILTKKKKKQIRRHPTGATTTRQSSMNTSTPTISWRRWNRRVVQGPDQSTDYTCGIVPLSLGDWWMHWRALISVDPWLSSYPRPAPCNYSRPPCLNVFILQRNCHHGETSSCPRRRPPSSCIPLSLTLINVFKTI